MTCSVYLRSLAAAISLIAVGQALAANTRETLTWTVETNNDVMHNKVTRELRSGVTFADALEVQATAECHEYGFKFTLSTFRGNTPATFALVTITVPHSDGSAPAARASLKIDGRNVRPIFASRPYNNSVAIEFADPDLMRRAFYRDTNAYNNRSLFSGMQRAHIDQDVMPYMWQNMIAGRMDVLDQATSIWVELPLEDSSRNVVELSPQDTALRPFVQQCMSSLGLRSVGAQNKPPPLSAVAQTPSDRTRTVAVSPPVTPLPPPPPPQTVETQATPVPEQDVEAARRYKLAADHGDADAQLNLGMMYRAGRGGLAPDPREAARLYKLSADQGNAVAQLQLAYMYENGDVLPKDWREAARLYRLAADQGNAEAQANLADFYERGDAGLRKNVCEAMRLRKLAAAQGNTYAERSLKGASATRCKP